MSDIRLAARGIGKTFGPVRALHGDWQMNRLQP